MLYFWAFVHEWTNYFPYWKDTKFLASNYLKKLIGKNMQIRLYFLDVDSKVQKTNQKEKKLIPLPNQKKPCDYQLFGNEIHEKGEKF